MGNNITTDIIVVGSGATGLVAALTAAENGAKVMIFEKQRSPGGTSNFFGGTFAVESEFQRKRGITYSRDDAFKNIMGFNHWKGNARLVRAIVDESSKTIIWLQQQGIEFVDMESTTYHAIKGHGANLVRILTQNAKDKGIELKLGTPVKELLREGDRIAGIVYEQDGEEVEVAAKAVIIATGGYANNKEWIKKYTGLDLGVNVTVIGNVDKMGEGIRMAWEAGAAPEGMGLLELTTWGFNGPDAVYKELGAAASQPDLWVNPKGERFCDESIVFFPSDIGNASARIKEGFSYRLFDNTIKERLETWGVDHPVYVDCPIGTRLLNMDKEFKAAAENGSTEVFEADSIEELAVKMGIEPAVLKATVEEYNHFCAQGHDDLFVKDRKYLRPLLGPKYYAVLARTVFLGTIGGIKVNHNFEAVDKNDNPVPGLYAGGFDAAGLNGDTYCITAGPGLCSATAMNSGRIAGRNAAKYVTEII
ncbi:FAD-dependent oxidoreductase [Dehalobacter sp. DCM]|uniref:FAD-dependent oxidoreductase n=1 Tax=Dehalobacter sp. DCM TaxID=2907827 RepID=UPI003081F8E3|nr:FAD-dependent oxidoreductase [Dehalobacter sp. DCM]